MSKSIDQVWREMQQRRQAELQRQAILERQIQEERQRAQREYVLQMRLNERSVAVAAAAAAAAGAGGGGSKKVSVVAESTTGQSYLVTWVDSVTNTFKIAVFNHSTGTLSTIIDTELSADKFGWSLYYNGGAFSVQEKGFTLPFVSDTDVKIYYLNFNGGIIDIKDLDDSNYTSQFNFSEAKSTVLGEINGTTVVYNFDGEKVNTFSVDAIVSDVVVSGEQLYYNYNDYSQGEVTSSGSIVIIDTATPKYYLGLSDGSLVDVTSDLSTVSFSDLLLDYNTNFISKIDIETPDIKIISEEGALLNTLALPEEVYNNYSGSLYGENSVFYILNNTDPGVTTVVGETFNFGTDVSYAIPPAEGTYTNVEIDTNGSGTGLIMDVEVSATVEEETLYTIVGTLVDGGSGYAVDDSIFIQLSRIGAEVGEERPLSESYLLIESDVETTEGSKLAEMVAYDGDLNQFASFTFSLPDIQRTYFSKKLYTAPIPSFGTTLTHIQINGSVTSSPVGEGFFGTVSMISWLPKGQSEFLTHSLEGLGQVYLHDPNFGDSGNSTFMVGENPMILFGTPSSTVYAGFLTDTGFVTQSTGISSGQFSDPIVGGKIGDKTFAGFTIEDSIVTWQIYDENSIVETFSTTVDYTYGSTLNSVNMNGTFVVLDTSEDASASVSYIYTTEIGLQEVSFDLGAVYNYTTHGNRTGLSSEFQLIEQYETGTSFISGFYLLSKSGLSDLISVTSALESDDHQTTEVIIGDNMISLLLEGLPSNVIKESISFIGLFPQSPPQPGNYTNIEVGSDGSGTGLIMDVFVTDLGLGNYNIVGTLVDGGTGYAVDDKLTVSTLDLGGSGVGEFASYTLLEDDIASAYNRILTYNKSTLSLISNFKTNSTPNLFNDRVFVYEGGAENSTVVGETFNFGTDQTYSPEPAEGTYTNVEVDSNGSGTGLIMDVVVTSIEEEETLYTIVGTLVNGGSGYSSGESISIQLSRLGAIGATPKNTTDVYKLTDGDVEVTLGKSTLTFLHPGGINQTTADVFNNTIYDDSNDSIDNF